jgi:hypothetical protein
MLGEPNNGGAEERLKRYAEERRREMGAPELDAATRRVLRGEVARVYGARVRGAEGRSGWRRWLLAPGFGWAMGLALVAGLTLLVVKNSEPRRLKEDRAPANAGVVAPKKGESVEKGELKPKAQEELVKNESAAGSGGAAPVMKAEKPKGTVVVAPPSAAPAAAGPELAETREKKVSLEKEVARAPVQVRREDEAKAKGALKEAAPMRGLRDENGVEEAGPVFANRANLRVETRAPEASAGAPAKLPKDMVALGGGGRAGADGAAQAQAAQAQVLNRFRMRQVGQTVRFEDSDKSVYAGPVTAERAGTNSFRAVGTNLTLRQPVVVTGQYYKMPMQTVNQAQAPAEAQTRQYSQQQFGGRQMLGAGQDEYRVQGQATVGSSNQVLIDAASAGAAP